MRLIAVESKNFSSYEDLNFTYADQGLSLVHGPTGSGKSVFQDLACWILYGQTAKGVKANDIMRWGADGPTTGTLTLETQAGKLIRVTRVRAHNNKNDLYFCREGQKVRGKDLTDTQKLLDQELKADYALYSTAAYFSEFSSTANFFTCSAKERRFILEKIANLQFSKDLQTKATEQIKLVKKHIAQTGSTLKLQQKLLESHAENLSSSIVRHSRWEADQKRLKTNLLTKSKMFEELKQSKIKECESLVFQEDRKNLKELEAVTKKITVLQELILQKPDLLAQKDKIEYEAKCKECGSLTKNTQQQLLSVNNKLNQIDLAKSQLTDLYNQAQAIKSRKNPYLGALQAAKDEINTVEADLQELNSEVSPYLDLIKQQESKLNDTEAHVNRLQTDLDQLYSKKLKLEQVQSAAIQVNSSLLEQAVSKVSFITNEKLKACFDGALSISLNILDTDNLEVQVLKRHTQCEYAQLSKGQRGILKLCFMMSVMEAASERFGVHFDTLFFDEALDGLDDNLKTRSYDLFLKLSQNHNSVYVIDHSEAFKTLFSNSFEVEYDGEKSKIKS